MSRCCRNFLDTITRRKPWDVRSLYQTEMDRTLNTLELVGIGVGSCAGLGVFIMSAHVTKTEAGPAAVLSVLVAGILALLSGLCHMELTTRLPRSGTGYTFCYITLGELLAFVIGWSTVLEHAVIGALASKGVWQYVEYMINVTEIRNVTSASSQMTSSADIPILSSSPDLFPGCLVVAVVFVGFITIKRYALINLISTCVSGVVVLAFICVGFLHVDPDNWNAEPGFFAKGFSGVLAGAALLMCVFAGVDNLSSCSEESKNPSQSLPTAFGFVSAIVSTVLFLATAALTLASPWRHLADDAALARAYEDKGIYAAHYVVGVGAVLGLLPVAFGSFLHPIRVLYAMSEDRLVPKVFSKRAYNGIPLFPHFLTGILITLCTLFVDFYALLEMASIATIIQFISSAIILLFIRYQPLPVGICKEYSDLDLYVADDLENASLGVGVKLDDEPEFAEKQSKLVIMGNVDCRIHNHHNHHRDEESLFHDLSASETRQSPDIFKEKQMMQSNTNVIVNPTQSLLTSSTPLLSSSKTVLTSSKSTKTVPIPPQQQQQPPMKFVNRFKTDRQQQNNNTTTTNDLQQQLYKKPMCTEASGESHVVNYNNKVDKHSRPTSTEMKNSFRLVATSGKRDSKSAPYDGLATNRYGSIRSVASSISSSIVALSPGAVTQADEQTWKHTRFFLLTYVTSSTCTTALFWMWPTPLQDAWWAVTLLCLSAFLMLASAICIARQPQNTTPLFFRTPYAPLVPLLAITGNMAMLASLPFLSWFRFAVWLLPGLCLYIFYSQRHSINQNQDEQEVVLFDISQLSSTSHDQ